MAKFKVGDRVRVIRSRVPPYKTAGREATILSGLVEGINYGDGLPYMGHMLDVDGIGRLNRFGMQMIALPEDLEPLVPPAVDAWASEQVKKWTKPEPVTTRVTTPAMSSES